MVVSIEQVLSLRLNWGVQVVFLLDRHLVPYGIQIQH